MDQKTSVYTASKYLLESAKLLVDYEKEVSKLLLDLAKDLLDKTFEVSDQNSTQEPLFFKSEAPNVTAAEEVLCNGHVNIDLTKQDKKEQLSQSKNQSSKTDNEEVLCNGHVNIDLTKQDKKEQLSQSKNQSSGIDNKNSACGINQNKVSDFMTRDIDTPEVTEIFEKIKAKLNKSKGES
jgi:hypothetical protein